MPVDMKSKIADTLNEMLEHRNLDSITVRELVDACHISRQSFYYHFKDILDVVEWYQDQVLARSIEKSLAAPTYQQAIHGVLCEAVQHRGLIRHLIASQNREEMERILVKAMRTYLAELVRKKVLGISCPPEDIEHVLSFYACGFAGMMLAGLDRKDLDVDAMAQQICRLLTEKPPLYLVQVPRKDK